MEDENAIAFRVYVSATIDVQTIPTLLSCEYSEDGKEGYDVQEVREQTTQDICRRHRQSAPPGGEFYSTLFLIIDNREPQTQGVLVVNLDPYHGYPDAVRHWPGDAGNVVGSLSIANSDWYDERHSLVEHKTALTPEKWFALYSLVDSDDAAKFDVALRVMNEGVQSVGVDGSPGELGVTKQYHRGIRPDSHELPDIKAAHSGCAVSHGLAMDMFAVVDQEYDSLGPLFVKISPEEDSFRCTNPVAGEILGWIFINFMTWEDAKEFAGRQ